MSNLPRSTAPQMESTATPAADDQGLMVVVDVCGSSRDKHFTVVRQAIVFRDGKLQFAGPKKEVRVETFEWMSR